MANILPLTNPNGPFRFLRRRTMIRGFTVVLISLTVAMFGGRAGAQGDPAVSVTLWYTDCPESADASQPRVTIIDWLGHPVLNRTWPRLDHAALRRLDFSLSPGFYQAVAANGACAGVLRLTVLSGHPRTVAVIGARRLRLGVRRAMLSGTLPSPGWRVAIVYPDLPPVDGLGSDSAGHLQIAAQVEQNAYYATDLPEGQAVVRLYSPLGDEWIDFAAGRIDLSLQNGKSALIKNITVRDLEAALAGAKVDR